MVRTNTKTSRNSKKSLSKSVKSPNSTKVTSRHVRDAKTSRTPHYDAREFKLTLERRNQIKANAKSNIERVIEQLAETHDDQKYYREIQIMSPTIAADDELKDPTFVVF